MDSSVLVKDSFKGYVKCVQQTVAELLQTDFDMLLVHGGKLFLPSFFSKAVCFFKARYCVKDLLFLQKFKTDSCVEVKINASL